MSYRTFTMWTTGSLLHSLESISVTFYLKRPPPFRSASATLHSTRNSVVKLRLNPHWYTPSGGKPPLPSVVSGTTLPSLGTDVHLVHPTSTSLRPLLRATVRLVFVCEVFMPIYAANNSINTSLRPLGAGTVLFLVSFGWVELLKCGYCTGWWMVFLGDFLFLSYLFCCCFIFLSYVYPTCLVGKNLQS